MSEAVGIEEYDINIRTALALLSEASRRIIVIGEPPIGWEPAIDVPAANRDLIEYNQRARRAAEDHHALYIDLWDDINYTATCFGWSPTTPAAPAPGVPSIWSDGVHLSEHGDDLLHQIIAQRINEHRVLDDLLTLDRADVEVRARNLLAQAIREKP